MLAGKEEKVHTNATLTQFGHLKQLLYHQPFQIINRMVILSFSNNNEGIEIFLQSRCPMGGDIMFLFVSQHFFVLRPPPLKSCSALGCYPDDLLASVSMIHHKMVALPVQIGGMITFLPECFSSASKGQMAVTEHTADRQVQRGGPCNQQSPSHLLIYDEVQ